MIRIRHVVLNVNQIPFFALTFFCCLCRSEGSAARRGDRYGRAAARVLCGRPLAHIRPGRAIQRWARVQLTATHQPPMATIKYCRDVCSSLVVHLGTKRVFKTVLYLVRDLMVLNQFFMEYWLTKSFFRNRVFILIQVFTGIWIKN